MLNEIHPDLEVTYGSSTRARRSRFMYIVGMTLNPHTARTDQSRRWLSIKIRKIADIVHAQIAQSCNLTSGIRISILSHYWSIRAQIKRRPIN